MVRVTRREHLPPKGRNIARQQPGGKGANAAKQDARRQHRNVTAEFVRPNLIQVSGWGARGTTEEAKHSARPRQIRQGGRQGARIW